MKLKRIGYLKIPVYRIPVQVLPSEENWIFVPIKNKEGYHVAIF